MSLPQLRVRTGFSTREIYGRMPEIFARLEEVGAKTAVIVDTLNTWGHVKFEKAARKQGIQSGFGCEIPVVMDMEDKFRPKSWVIGLDTRKLYNFTSKAVQGEKKVLVTDLQECEGLLRFVGGALAAAQECPDAFDYVDVNPSSYWQAHSAVRLALSKGLPIVLTSFVDLPSEKHKPFAYAWETRDSVGNRYIATADEMWESLQHVMARETFSKAVENTHLVAERLQGIHLQRAPLIHLEGNLLEECRIGQASRLSRGHISEWTQEYEDRLQEELHQIEVKEFGSYFLLVADMIRFAKTKMLVGPARGSSSGSIVCYLMGITEVDPLVHNLMFQRFIDVSRGGFEYEKFTGFGAIPFGETK